MNLLEIPNFIFCHPERFFPFHTPLALFFGFLCIYFACSTTMVQSKEKEKFFPEIRVEKRLRPSERRKLVFAIQE
jgi:hypothetical protein